MYEIFLDHYHSNCFKCLNGLLIVPQSKVCDGVADCEDFSDECLCDNEVIDCSSMFDGNDSLKHGTIIYKN